MPLALLLLTALVASQPADARAEKSLPGKLGPSLLEAGEKDAACAVYEADLRAHPERAGAAALRAARCLSALEPSTKKERAEHDQRLSAALETLLADPFVGQDVLVAEEAAAAYATLAGEEAAAQKLGWVLDLEPLRSDAERREAHGRLLLRVARSGGEAERAKALRRLYVDLAETAATDEALKLPAGRQLARHKDQRLALARAEVLTDHHDNAAVLRTLKRYRPKRADVSETACKVRYLLGKAHRKMRRYRSARRDLDVVAERCPEPWRKKARYLAARVATFQGKKGTEALLDRFLSAYPDDTLTDDVLVWKADLLAKQKRFEEADKVFARIAAEHPSGDMLHRARFDRAFLRAERHDVEGALALLDEIARTSLKAPAMISDQALYWRGRLKAFPDLASWKVTSDKAKAQEGAGELLGLATTRPASFYGHLAGQVVEQLAGELGLDEGEVKKKLSAARLTGRQGEGAGWAVPSRLDDPRLQATRHILAGGYQPEAALVLDRVSSGDLDEGDQAALPVLYAQAGRLDRTHQVMRSRGYALPPGRPEGDGLALWSLAFPRAHDAHLKAAAEAAEVPHAIMLGLAREESAFEASVVSWAGAIGLCQLMPFTAKEEAQLARYKGSTTTEALREPGLNARLGAAHLGRRWRQLDHPLLAIAAYNAGPGNVKKWLRRLPDPIDTFVEGIPVEQTRGYVRKVTGSWVTYTVLDPEDFSPVRYSLTVP